jgi:hypothetical protein
MAHQTGHVCVPYETWPSPDLGWAFLLVRQGRAGSKVPRWHL